MQSSQPTQVPSHLEQQVRRLAEYDRQNATEHTTGTPAHAQHQSHATPEFTVRQTDDNFPQYQLPERGAKIGKMLNLACVECNNRKRKCSKDFPCIECLRNHARCTPSVRKLRTSVIANAEPAADQPNEDAADAVEQAERPASGKPFVRNHNDPNSYYRPPLPPVFDGFQEWSNKRLPYTPIPDDVDAVREMLFKLEKPVLINSQQYADYWPHISNIYSRGVGPKMEANGTEVETWECRNQRRQSYHQRAKERGGQGIRKRERKHHLLEGTETCKVRFRLVAYIKHAVNDEDHRKGPGNCDCVPEWLYMEKTKLTEGESHNHTLESLDKYKRTDAMVFFALHKVMEGGYMYKSVASWIIAKYGHITKQAEFLNHHDVANAAKRWRSQNREVELIEQIPEPSPEDERREKCLKLIHTTTVDGLRNALKEVCARLPEAAAIALPLLESSQLPETAAAEAKSKILQGEEIVVPEPGLPLYRFLAPKPKPPMEMVTDNSTDLRPGDIHGSGPPTQPQQFGAPLAPAQTPPQYPGLYQQPLPPPPIPPQSHLPTLAPMLPPSQVFTPIHFQLPPPPGAYSVINGGDRLHMPTNGSKMAMHVNDMRPSWARTGQPDSNTPKDKQVEETEEKEVLRQLEAELLA